MKLARVEHRTCRLNCGNHKWLAERLSAQQPIERRMLRHARFDRDGFRFQLDVRRMRDALRGDGLTAAGGRNKSSNEEVQDTSPHRVGGSVAYLLRRRD